jgi:hypothetical protein
MPLRLEWKWLQLYWRTLWHFLVKLNILVILPSSCVPLLKNTLVKPFHVHSNAHGVIIHIITKRETAQMPNSAEVK